MPHQVALKLLLLQFLTRVGCFLSDIIGSLLCIVEWRLTRILVRAMSSDPTGSFVMPNESWGILKRSVSLWCISREQVLGSHVHEWSTFSAAFLPITTSAKTVLCSAVSNAVALHATSVTARLSNLTIFNVSVLYCSVIFSLGFFSLWHDGTGCG